MESLLRVADLCLNFGGTEALNNINVEVRRGEIMGLIGPNGAGKTCLVNCVCGFYRPQTGEISIEGKTITGTKPYRIAKLGIARTFQNMELFTGLTVLENLVAARQSHMKYGILGSAMYFGPALKEEIREREVAEKIIKLLEIEHLRKKVVGVLPYGDRKRVELGRALALEPKLLFLDEPMAGMNVEEKEDMARFIIELNEEMEITMVLVEHDMGVVMDICDRIVVLDFGRKIAEGSPNEIGKDELVIKAYLGDEVTNR